MVLFGNSETSNFTDTIADESWTVGTAVSLSAPATEDGEIPITYAISPAVPAGMTFDTSDGSIGGTPTAVSTETEYTITATDDNGIETTTTFSASVAASGGSLSTPTAPENLTATPQSNGTEVLLDWDVPSDDGGASISDYEYSDDNGNTYTAIGSTDTDYTVTGLDKNTDYDFKVRGVNSQGSGTATATVSETTSITTATVPQNLTITVPTNGTSLELDWDAPTDDGGEVTDYEYSTDDGSSWSSTGGTTTDYTVTGLDKGTEYDVKVRAVNSAGNGTASATATATTDTTVANAPTALTVTVGETTADLSWTAPSDDGGTPITSYEVSSDDGSTWADTGDADLSYEITGLTADTDYDFKVRAVNAEGSGTASSTVSDTTDAAAVELGFGSSTIAAQAWVVGMSGSLILPVATGGTGDKTYTLIGTLPAGATFDASTRELEWDPTGRYASADFVYTAEDEDGTQVTLDFTIVVTAPTFEFDSAFGDQEWIEDEAVSVTLPSASGGVGTKTYALTGTLPTGVTRSAFAVTGTPTAVMAVMTYTWTATDAEGIEIEDTFAIVVAVSTAEADRLESQRQTRLDSILPVTSTQMEVDLLAAFQEVLNDLVLQEFGSDNALAIPVRHLWNPDTSPTAFLPYLACAMSVDADISLFTETQQRELIRTSFEVHRRKGTVGSIKRVVEALGWDIADDGFVEGRRDTTDMDMIVRENGGWAQFTIEIMNTIPIAQAREAFKLVQNISPVSRRLYSFDFSSVPKFYDGGVNSEGIFTFLSDGQFTHGAVASDETLLA